jgi:predicted O-linked N-acetylglucosamine transferase (SPINDLY family)
MVPDIEGLVRVGNQRLDEDRPDEAVACFQQVLELRPADWAALSNLAFAYFSQAKVDDAIACYQKALNADRSCVQAHDNLIFALQFSPDYDAAAIFAECRRWNQQHAAVLERFIEPHLNDRTPDRKLRIGYVSPDFRTHASALFLLPLLESHDRQHFEIFCYSNVAAPDFVTARLQQLAQAWRDIHALSDEQTAGLIRRDEIDILIDLKVHGERNRLLVFARKPAPVQVTWLGYPGTTGLTTIDYRLTDPYLDPSGLYDDCYSERSVRLPDTFWCYSPIALTLVRDLPALHNGYITFGSLNAFFKVNRDVLGLWARVLRAVERSRLILLASEGSSRQWVLDILALDGISADRIDFVNRQPRGRYLETYHRIDIALDTFPYNGHTTTLDALWMGVPLVTLVGQTVVGRAGCSQLTNVGLPELIAQAPEEFVNIAAGLASNLDRLRQLRSMLRPQMERSPLMDAARFTRNLEAACRQLWHRWCQT